MQIHKGIRIAPFKYWSPKNLLIHFDYLNVHLLKLFIFKTLGFTYNRKECAIFDREHLSKLEKFKVVFIYYI